MLYIENEGALFRGPARGVPLEIWHPREGKFVPYRDAGKPKDVAWGTVIDEAEARLMMDESRPLTPSPQERPDLYDGYDGQTRAPLTVDYLAAITPDYVRQMFEDTHGKPFSEIVQEMAAESRASIDKTAPMLRWSPDELASVKAYLEARQSADFTREDHYLMLEYLVRRYLPADEQITDGEWQAKMQRLYARVDANAERIERGEPAEPVKDDPDFAAWMQNLFSRNAK